MSIKEQMCRTTRCLGFVRSPFKMAKSEAARNHSCGAKHASSRGKVNVTTLRLQSVLFLHIRSTLVHTYSTLSCAVHADSWPSRITITYSPCLFCVLLYLIVQVSSSDTRYDTHPHTQNCTLIPEPLYEARGVKISECESVRNS